METTFNNGRRPRKKRHSRRSHERSVDSIASFTLTPHAELRAAQRGLTRQDIDYVLRYGRLYHACEAAIYFLRAVDIPDGDHRHMKRLEGTAVFAAPDHPSVLTVWRNRQHGSRNIHRKLAQVWRKERLTVLPEWKLITRNR